VWSRLTFMPGSSTDTETDSASYELRLGNVGIGPALITKFEVSYRGQALRVQSGPQRLATFFDRAAAEAQVKSQRKLHTSQRELDPGTVIAASNGRFIAWTQAEVL
jgi:hypothetical protein